MKKFKVRITRADGSTIHGALRANSREGAQGMLYLKGSCQLGSIEEIPVNQACFYDTEFERHLLDPLYGPAELTKADHDAFLRLAKACAALDAARRSMTPEQADSVPSQIDGIIGCIQSELCNLTQMNLL